MITVSLCMIVKNEEKVLRRCLDSLKGLMDEIIIVDTGSTDNTKKIAAEYTDRIYDFEWTDDFSEARNFSFSKATMDYIYTADADEVIDSENFSRFMNIKECMMEEIEIVQMKYINENADNNLQNSRVEYRPKLFKRLRTFTWTDPVHETVRTWPVVFDSDICILHKPEGVHGTRDLSIFYRHTQNGGRLSKRIRNMYARELLNIGTKEDFDKATEYFERVYADENIDDDSKKEAACVLARSYRFNGDMLNFFKYALKDVLTESCSEMCYELGEMYFASGDYIEASIWYYNAIYETSCILDIHTSGDLSLYRIAECYDKLSINDSSYADSAKEYAELARKWEMPEELI